MSISPIPSINPLMHAHQVNALLEQYDDSFDLYKAYNERLLINLGEVFNRTTLPISSVNGELMSRGTLKKIALEKGGYLTHLKDIGNVITVRVVVYFNDDIDLAVQLIGKEFVLKEPDLLEPENAEQDRFGINTRRFAIQLLPEQYQRLEYQRFVSIKAELEIRTVLQHSWSEVKGVFDLLISRANLPGQQVHKLAQISFLLKMADDELVRIKEQIMDHSNVVPFDSAFASRPVEPATPAPPPAPEEPAFHEDARLDERKRIFFVKKMEMFVLNDPLVRELDRAIADHYETRLVYKENFVTSLAEVFLRISIDSEERLREELTINKQVILTIMKNIFGSKEKSSFDLIHKGSALLVLYYLILAKTGNIEIIKRNIKNYISLKGISVEAFANDLLTYYKKALNKEI